MLNTFLGGLRLGIILQLSVGPVFLFVLQTAIPRGIPSALLAVTAVTLIDACYILLALLGIGTWLQNNPLLQKRLRYLSALILLLFALQTFFPAMSLPQFFHGNATLTNSFAAAAVLTLSNPLTIIFWLGILSAQLVKEQFTNLRLFIFCCGCISATFIVLSGTAFLCSKATLLLTPLLQQLLKTFISGFLMLMAYKTLFSH